MATPATRLVTLEEVSEINTDERFEVVCGEIVPMAPTASGHGGIALQIAAAIAAFLRLHRIGEAAIGDVGIVLQREPLILRCPDIAFVSNDRLPPVDQRSGFLEVAPDLAVEVVSPVDRMTEVSRKVSMFLEHGTRQVWVVDPGPRTVVVYDAREPSVQRIYRPGDVLDGGDVLPGFSMTVTDIFA